MSLKRANVQVDQLPVGELFVPGMPDPAVFTYRDKLKPSQAVSVTMPVDSEAVTYPGIHPIFAQNLPEGYLADILRKTISKLQGAGDLVMLTALGRYQVGRVIVTSPDQMVDESAASAGESMSGLLESGNSALFEELVSKYALRSGISGVQPKVLVPARVEERGTLKTEGFIVKSWGDDYPQLAANEYFCMRVARSVGLAVPDFDLSADARLFVMKRFDRDGEGNWLGFEDACVLQGLPPLDKYSGSYERLARSISAFVSPDHRMQDLTSLFLSLLVSRAVGNGDAHLKNFGILYSSPFAQRRLAPAYDIVSTLPYLNKDVPALTLAGKKTWWDPRYLKTFGRTACGLSEKEVVGAFHQVALALDRVRVEMEQYAADHSAFREIGAAMTQIFATSAQLFAEVE
ncbi:type II toxin-antitoxin system HipA family toxin [Nitrincola sp. MINF-07-Sa-05]|uniref:type II toxin-antitoxin system HipA family toxin n=1 Tax=Nitrincola salilacus TaxID=3400273 RepID=UPI00391848D8